MPGKLCFGLGIDRKLHDEQLVVFHPHHKIRSVQCAPPSIKCENVSEGTGQTTLSVSYNGEVPSPSHDIENLGDITFEFEGGIENRLQIPVSFRLLPLLSPLPANVLLSETKKDSQGIVTEKVAIKILDRAFTGNIRANVLESWVTLTEIKEGSPYCFFTFQFCLKDVPANRKIPFVRFVPETVEDYQHRDITVTCLYQK